MGTVNLWLNGFVTLLSFAALLGGGLYLFKAIGGDSKKDDK